ncbi:unknown [Clostridium sp. CAG:768]|nr:unknown [Clostridium sp. CAG:768]
MKRFQADQTQKSCKFADNCVDLSTNALVGGGAI